MVMVESTFSTIWTLVYVLKPVKRWCKIISEIGFIGLTFSPRNPLIVRRLAAIQNLRIRWKGKKIVSIRILSNDLDVSKTNIRITVKVDLRHHPYKIVEPHLTHAHKVERKQLETWVRWNFGKQKTMNILFSDEKCFHISGI